MSAVIVDSFGKRVDHLANQASVTWETPSAQSVWEYTHGMNKYPSIITIDADSGERCFGDEEYVDRNTVRVTFLVPVSGTLILN